MKVSVIVCTYNGSNYIEEQLNSIYLQDYCPYEVIICDDNSQDNTLSIIESLAGNYPQISTKIYRHKQRLGYIKNFEFAIKKTTGDYVFFSDQDDIWKNNKIRTFLECFKTGKFDLIFSNAFIYKDGKVEKNLLSKKVNLNKTTINEINSGNAFDILLKFNVITGATMAIKREIVNKVTPFSELMVHDAWIGLVVSCIGNIHYINEPLIYYRQHNNNQIGVQSNLINEAKVKNKYDHRKKGIIEFNTLKEFLKSKEEVDNSKILKIEKKITHFTIREGNKSFKDVPILLVELFKGRYSRYSNGIYSFAKDIYHIKK